MYVKSTSAQPQLKSTLIKGFISRAKQIERNLRNGFVDERQRKTIMPKNKCFPEYTYYLLARQT